MFEELYTTTMYGSLNALKEILIKIDPNCAFQFTQCCDHNAGIHVDFYLNEDQELKIKKLNFESLK